MSPIVSAAQTPVDVAARIGKHPDVARREAQDANRLGHLCRYCGDPACHGEQRDIHEGWFVSSESSSLLSTAQFFACPRCGGDERTAPSCQANDDDLRDLKPVVTRPWTGFAVGAGPDRRAAA